MKFCKLLFALVAILSLGCEDEMHPFTPLQTFTDNTVPKVDADFLNQLQAGLDAVARPFYLTRAQATGICLNGTDVTVFVGATMLKDAATSKYTYIDKVSTAFSVSLLAANTWYYTYVYSTNGVYSLEQSTTAPMDLGDSNCAIAPLWKTGDETRRFLFAYRTDGSGNILPFNYSSGRTDLFVSVQLVSLPGSTSFSSAVSTLSVAPPYRKRVLLRTGIQADGSTANQLLVRPSATSLSGIPAARTLQGGVNAAGFERISLPVLGGAGFEWVTAVAHDTIIINGEGWED